MTVGAPHGERFDALRALGMQHLLRVSLRGRDGALGLLTFGAARRFDANDVRLAEELAGRAASAIENAQLDREAQSSTRAREAVLAVVSHDLRNPVHTITMSTSFLLDLPRIEDKLARAQLDVIQRSAGRAVVGAPHDALTVFADRDRVLQALDNLLGKAVKFTPPEGRVELDATSQAGGVRFEVRDTGPGVAPSEQPNLFRPFWPARRVDRRGVGLGLSIVKGIVDAHGGSIEVDSDGRTGTRIGLTIPERADASRALAGSR